jgi:MerR family transcriptional regulator, Zn(II)-responsive regulator of zntA
MFKISEIAKKLGINPQTLYFYERIGLIKSPQRTEAGYRLYSQEDWERLSFITNAKSLGLSLAEIKQLLQLKEDQSLSCQEVYQKLRDKVQEIDAQIANLQALKAEILPLMQKCQINGENKPENSQCIVLSLKQLSL